jgi:hypothetical protein
MGDVYVDLYEYNTHPFVVKIWLEESKGDRRPTWRGHITHVPSGDRRYFRRLDDIVVFIAPHLEEMGVPLGLWWQIRRWLSRANRRRN